MSLAIKYETLEDARMRLRQTVVLYEGQPVLIREIARAEKAGDEIFRVLFDALPTKKGGIDFEEQAKRKYISSKHFDIAPFKMGYVNAPNGAFYCTRLPNRMQKQGLCGENFQGKDNYGNPVNFATFLNTKEVVAMVNGQYPTFAGAVKALSKCPSVAFSRDFCIMKDEIMEELLFLYHKGKKVGVILNEKITLGKGFLCLKESLEELGLRMN